MRRQMLRRAWRLCWGVVLLGVPAAWTSEGPRIPGFERFYAAEGSPAREGGVLLLSELNCLSCHVAEANFWGEGLTPRQAPVLDDVGNRVRPEWLHEYLTAPHRVKPGTAMPDVLSPVPEERAEQVAALVHFLASTGAVADTHSDRAAVRRGERLYHRVGCTACHNPRDGQTMDLPTSAPLPDLGKKYTAGSLAAFLKDPLKVRPSGRMPAFPLKDEEFRDLAQYFLQDVKLPANVKYAVYYGDWEKLPNFEELRPERTGECAGFDLSVAQRRNHFGIRFTTNFYVRNPAQHQFYLSSDDGSRLMIGGEVIVDNDGIHPQTEEKGRHSFTEGWHPVVVDYFQGGGEIHLEVEVDGNGLKRQPLSALVSLSTDKPPHEETRWSVDPEKAARGRQLFASLGCAACHSLRIDGKPLAPGSKAKPWKELTQPGGCLAEPPAAGVPRYGLSGPQRGALASVLGMGPMEAPPADVVHRTMVTLNCYACHRRGEEGGVEEARNGFFESLQKEMGDEGRLPPPLTGVGDKLTDGWLKHLLEQGANDRQLYMQAKMPKFGGRNVGHLVAALAAVDRQPDSVPPPEFPEPDYRVKAAGRHLVGGNALSCIKCHDFGPHPSQGVRAINLTTMPRRLRADWFVRYLRDPQAFRPGTRMPAPWPFGQATVKEVLQANVDWQIWAVWRYLSDGDKAAVPVGLVREPIELKPTESPIIYRNFIEGAGSRAIGVGYPEQAHVAWDANDMRLALIWHGAFIDASRHWNGRGAGFESPLGDDVLALPAGPPLARLNALHEVWPKDSARDSGYRFRGYRLDPQRRPVFQYAVHGVTVDDFLLPVVSAENRYPTLRRTLTFTTGSPGEAAAGTWYFRAAVGRVEQTAQGRYQIDGVWTLSVLSDAAPVIRETEGRQELLIPVKFDQPSSEIALEYLW